MTYHDFSECTLNADERFHEKNRIIRMLDESGIIHSVSEEREIHFLEHIRHEVQVTVKQLFWLRDIKDKYFAKEDEE